MTSGELHAVIGSFPELAAGLPDHIDEAIRIAERIVHANQHPPEPLPWRGLPDLERVRRFDELYPPRGRA